MKTLESIATVFLILGGLALGIIGLWKVNIIDYVFQHMMIDRLFYIAIGISAVFMLTQMKKR